MNRAELIEALAEKSGLSKQKAKKSPGILYGDRD